MEPQLEGIVCMCVHYEDWTKHTNPTAALIQEPERLSILLSSTPIPPGDPKKSKHTNPDAEGKALLMALPSPPLID